MPIRYSQNVKYNRYCGHIPDSSVITSNFSLQGPSPTLVDALTYTHMQSFFTINNCNIITETFFNSAKHIRNVK